MRGTAHESRRADTERLRRELGSPAAYAHAVDEVGFLETHCSLLFFAGERVYKVKKPVDLGFLDFTTLERRRHFCEEEVRLNARLAPGVYLGVVAITSPSPGDSSGALRIDGDGEVVDWAVEMVRLPEHRMLANLLERGEIDNQQMNVMADLLAGFHAASATGPGVDEHGSIAAIRANVEQNFEQLAAFVDTPGESVETGVLSPELLRFLGTRARAALEEHAELFEERVREGRIREGHGDLHAGNICFTAAGPVAYDCIEFGPAFRCGDVAADLAFLAMDLDVRGYPGFSGYLVRRYAEVAGDARLPELAPFYKGYRAIVRGKVAALAAADPGLPAERRLELRREAMRYLQLAAAYELPPALFLMCGLPASGKSWLARRLASAFRAAVLHSDVRRKRLSGMVPTTRVHAEYGTGLYTPEARQRTYDSLLADTRDQLGAGHSLIVDATFARRAIRAPFLRAASDLGVPAFVVHVTAPEEVVRQRLTERAHDPRTSSDADLEVYLGEKAAFEAPTEVPPEFLVEVVSGAGLPEHESARVVERRLELPWES